MYAYILRTVFPNLLKLRNFCFGEKKYFNENPIYDTQKYCELWNYTLPTGERQQVWPYSTFNTSANLFESSTEWFDENSTTTVSSTRTSATLTPKLCYDYTSGHKNKSPPEPNIALISLILVIGTCTLTLLLKKLRLSNFLGSYVCSLCF